MQDEGVVQILGKPFGAVGFVFDDFDVVFGLELLGEAVADVATAGNHDAAGTRFFRTQFAHDGFNAVDVGGKQDFIAFDDDGLRGGDDQAVVAVDGADLAVHTFGQVLVDVGNFTADQQTAFAGLNNHHADLVVGKAEYLQCAGVAEQADKLLGNQLFGADGFGNAEDVEAAFFGIVATGNRIFEVFA